MIRSIHSSSSSSSSKTLSIIPPLTAEECRQNTPTHEQPPNTSRPHERTERSRRGPVRKEVQTEESLFDEQLKHGLGARSSTPPVEEFSQDNFFGLSHEYSFSQYEINNNLNIGLEPAFQSTVKSLPETSFQEPQPQSGCYGIDRYLATPRHGDAVRYYRP
ncbi:hypothetical protein TWF225_001615 [Orbilia oligospora]|uniref:Uncharacterized protein n=1 Tax=Orbilia oligospora TaxID=2813651 RepID=A0A7C8PEH3_ORBOL|nr:hypothetical protein TWF751_004889 [Orbilia oligospora]KAF3164627.1 hypothetical protein TWF225_001615 [Orbilia oligospora]KAF3237081.1 hypothetical protein TWF217_002208 [Orbilia oligospora]KAF3256732.1 hypothetical protein TWF128_005239 [Orbilia oligospora]KAF3292017.1 hypothetical protein TWF132_006263 [Orbilia oligospora]